MRNSNRFICMCVLAGLAVVLAGVSAAQADVVFSAPSPTLAAGTTNYDAVLSVSSTTGADTLQAFQLQVTLTKVSGDGTATIVGLPAVTNDFTAFTPTNYLFGTQGWAIVSSGFSLKNPTYSNASGAAVDDAPGTAVTLSQAYNVLKLPIAFTGPGVWSLAFTSNTLGTDGDFGDVFPTYQNGTITVLGGVQPPEIPAPLAAFGGMALFGLLGLRSWRRRQV